MAEGGRVIDIVLNQSHKVDGADDEFHLHHECLGQRSSRNRFDPNLRMSSPGHIDGATLEEENTDNQAKDKALSSVSSNPDKESDFVEVQEWQENDGKNCTLSLWIKYKRAPEMMIIKDMKKIPCSWNFHVYWNFYTKTKPGQQMLHEIVNKYNCSVTVCTDDEDLYIFEVTDKSFEEESDVVHYIHVVLENVYKCAQQCLYFDNLLVDQRIQGDVLQIVRQRKKLDCARIELMGQQDHDAMCVICTQKDKKSVIHVITEIIHNVRECYENREEIIYVDHKWQKVMKHFGYIQKLGDKYPKVTIILDESKPAIMLKGPRDQSKAAADHVMELEGTARSEVKEDIFSPGCQFEIFTYPEMCNYIDNIIMELSVVWIPNRLTKNIHLFSKKLEKIKGIDKLIKGCVQERLYPLERDQLVCSLEMFSSLEELKKKHTGKIVINSTPTGLLVTTADGIFESVDAAVQEIISKQTGLVKEMENQLPILSLMLAKIKGKQDLLHLRKVETSGKIIRDFKDFNHPEVEVKPNSDVIAKRESRKVSRISDKISSASEAYVIELKISQVHEEREAGRIRTTAVETGQLPKTSNENKDPADFKCSENSEVEISLELMEEIQSVKSEEISENEVTAAKHQISLELGNNRIENQQKKLFSAYDDSKDNKQPSSVFSKSSSPDNTKRSFTTADGINVFVYKCSILGAEVDVIVNAANEDLKHTGGVAKVIADAAGREFIEESKRYIRENGHLNVGASCITSGGNLNYPFVIHTVGPQWDKYSKTSEGVQNCMDDLLKAVIGCFIKAESLQVQSIALPAVSSGIYGVPMEICASQYLSAVMRYRKSRQGISSLKEIHFIDINEEVLALIVLVFSAALENNQAAAKEFDYKLQSVLSTFWHSSTPQTLKSTASFKKMGHSSEHLDPPYVLVKNKSKFQFTKVFSVLIYTGDITDSKCKAIVSSEDKDLKSQGGVAKAIKEKAGPVFDYSIANYRGMRHQVGDVIEIDGGKLECKVICCIIPKWTNKMPDEDYKRQLGQCFRSILEKAKTYRSVAMPLIGIGFNNNRIEICGRVLLDYLLQFSKVLRQKEAIREVHIVSLDDRTTAYVKSIFTEFFDSEKRRLDAEKRKHEDMEVDSASASGGQCQPPQNSHHKSKNTKQVNKSDELNKMRVEVDMDTTENLVSCDSGCNQPLKSQKINRDEDDMQDICAICLDTLDDPVKMKKCGHLFCKGCIDTQLQYKSVCPTCGTIYGIITGNQPKGKMTEKVAKHCDLKGYEGCGMIEITYYMPDGVQGDEHPKPGHRYYGLNRNAYLPNNEKGLKVLHLLHLAFDRRLIFTIGRSITTGQDDMVTWNDIHHKTSMHGGPQNFAYPDPTYLNRVLEELAAKGVTEESENQGPETFSAYERVVQ